MSGDEVEGGGEEELALRCRRLRVVPAEGAHEPLVQECFEEASAYFVQLEGAPPGPAAAAHLLADAEVDDRRRLFVVQPLAGGPVVGLLDLHLHYPEPGEAHLGLLLLRESSRGKGYGRELVAALEAALVGAGYHTLRLSVVRENTEARAFWEALRYAEAGRAEGDVTVFEKLLG